MSIKEKSRIIFGHHDGNWHWQWPTEFLKNSVAQLVIISGGYYHWCCHEDGSNLVFGC